MPKKLFVEKQYFNCIEVYFLMALFIAGFFYKIMKLLRQPDSVSAPSLFLALGLLVVFCILFVVLRKFNLSTSINKKYIKFRLYPLHQRKQKILLENIETCKIIRTHVRNQWHGGNISFHRYASYTFNGRNGVYIKTKDDNAYFIGSKKLDALQKVLEKVLPSEDVDKSKVGR